MVCFTLNVKKKRKKILIFLQESHEARAATGVCRIKFFTVYCFLVYLNEKTKKFWASLIRCNNIKKYMSVMFIPNQQVIWQHCLRHVDVSSKTPAFLEAFCYLCMVAFMKLSKELDALSSNPQNYFGPLFAPPSKSRVA